MVLSRQVVREEKFYFRRSKLTNELSISKYRGVLYFYTKNFKNNKLGKIKIVNNEIVEVFESIKEYKNYLYSLDMSDFYIHKTCKEFTGLPQKNFIYIFKHNSEDGELEGISLFYNRKNYKKHLYSILDVDLFEKFISILSYNPLYFIFDIDEDTGKVNNFVVGQLLDKKEL
jgi:hypothetical protein